MVEVRGSAPLEAIAQALRRERTRAGLSLTELARQAGIAKSTLSQLEAGTGNPSIETLWALSMSLDVPFSRLVEPDRPRVRVVRAGAGPTVFAEHADYASTLLSAAGPGTRRDLYLVRAEPGTPRLSEPHAAGTVEHIVLCAGRARAGITEEPEELNPGDYICYPGDLPHIFEALEPGTYGVEISEFS